MRTAIIHSTSAAPETWEAVLVPTGEVISDLRPERGWYLIVVGLFLLGVGAQAQEPIPTLDLTKPLWCEGQLPTTGIGSGGRTGYEGQPPPPHDKFFLGFAGSAVFPYDPNPLAGLGLKAGSGFTAAFGYAFKEGFSTEIEWGYQKVGIGGPSGLGRTIGPAGAVVSFGEGLPPFLIKFDGEIKTQSLMGNVYYRYPKWRVSPYVGFGLGAFFHDTTSTVSIEFGPLPPDELFGGPLTYEDSRFAYQIMGGLSARVSKRVEFRFGYRFRSSRGGPIDADQIESGIRFRF